MSTRPQLQVEHEVQSCALDVLALIPIPEVQSCALGQPTCTQVPILCLLNLAFKEKRKTDRQRRGQIQRQTE